MEPHIFKEVATYLRSKRFIVDTRITVEEKLGFFLYMLSRNASYEDLAVTFGHSNDTFHYHINHFFNKVIPTLSRRFLQSPNPNQVHPKILENPRYYPFFKNCLGAIDGTHIPTFPKIKKFQNNKASFPLFDALGELYDGGKEWTRKKPEKEGQRSRKSAKLKTMMERFLEMRTKQVEDEAKQLERENEARENEIREKEARYKEAAKGDEYSIKRCISIINTMEVTKQEKTKAYAIFTKSKENKETFICASEEDEESASIWLRNEMA
uniref:DUF8040 domain-containing protein n=1 Tax=Setaria italica TaxID=4555 RepID=K4A2P7_SETIT